MFNLNIPQNVVKDADTLGAPSVYNSDIYLAKVLTAYGTQSRNNAKGLVIKLALFNKDNSNEFIGEHTETFWVTKRDGSSTYIDKNGKERFMPGYTLADDFTKATAGKSLVEAVSEERTIPLYDFAVGKEVMTTVQMLTEALDAKFGVGLVKVCSNKKTKQGDVFVPTPDKVFSNQINKIFILTKDDKFLTINEKENNVEFGGFAEVWEKRWYNEVKDEYKTVSGISTSQSTNPLNLSPSSLDIS